MRVLLVAAALAAATPALAGETTGTLLAFDRKAKVIVMEDKTVWTLPAGLAVPENLEAGEKIHIVYTSDGDNGVTAINAIHRVES